MNKLEPGAQKLIQEKVDFSTVLSDWKRPDCLRAICGILGMKLVSEESQVDFISNMIPEKYDFARQFLNDNTVEIVGIAADYFEYDNAGKLIIPGGTEVWKSYLGDDLKDVDMFHPESEM